MLGSDYTVRNFGKSGATALKKGDVPYWNQAVFSQALKSDAAIITIMLGTNDTKPQNWDSHGGEFKSDYTSLIDTLQSANIYAKIFPVLPVPVCRSNYGITSAILEKQIPIIKEIADKKGLAVIDANTLLLSHCSYFSDGVHPNQSGADSIASVIGRTILGVTRSIADVSSVPVKRKADNVYSVVNGNVSAVFNRLTPGARYEISVFNLNGALLCKMYIDASSYSRRRVQMTFTQNKSMRLLRLKEMIK